MPSERTPQSVSPAAGRRPLQRFAGRVAVACAIVLMFVVAWQLREVVLLAFGGVVLAVVIRALAEPLIERAGWGERWAITAVVLALLAASLALSWLFGSQVTAQIRDLEDRLPRAIEQLRLWSETNSVATYIRERATGVIGESEWLKNAPKMAAAAVNSIGHAILMVFLGVYLAVNPRVYRGGLVRLFPVSHRSKIDAALGEAGGGLRRWLLGQLVSMTSVGLLTGLGLWAVGAPLPLALGLLAGLLEFIPVIGSIIAVVPGILVALTEGPEVALYAAIVYLVVQQLEGGVIMPLAQRWAVELPPALSLAAVVAFGLLFGFLGLLFGSPLAVVALILVQQLYVRHGLEAGRPATQAAER